MVDISTRTVVHQQLCGGLGFATVTEKKKKSNEYNSIDEIQHNVKRPTVGLLCQSCISCTRKQCYFAFRVYPNCYLANL